MSDNQTTLPVKTGMDEEHFKLIVSNTIKRQIEIMVYSIASIFGFIYLIKEYLPSTPSAIYVLIYVAIAILVVSITRKAKNEVKGLQYTRNNDEITELDVKYEDIEGESIFKVHEYIMNEIRAREQIETTKHDS